MFFNSGLNWISFVQQCSLELPRMLCRSKHTYCTNWPRIKPCSEKKNPLKSKVGSFCALAIFSQGLIRHQNNRLECCYSWVGPKASGALHANIWKFVCVHTVIREGAHMSRNTVVQTSEDNRDTQLIQWANRRMSECDVNKVLLHLVYPIFWMDQENKCAMWGCLWSNNRIWAHWSR